MADVALGALSKLGKPPPLSADEQFYYDAYYELFFDRQITMNGARMIIPVSAIITWADHVGLDDIERSILVRCVRAIDFIETQNFNKSIHDK